MLRRIKYLVPLWQHAFWISHSCCFLCLTCLMSSPSGISWDHLQINYLHLNFRICFWRTQTQIMPNLIYSLEGTQGDRSFDLPFTVRNWVLERWHCLPKFSPVKLGLEFQHLAPLPQEAFNHSWPATVSQAVTCQVSLTLQAATRCKRPHAFTSG